MNRGDLQPLSKDDLIELVLRLQRPDKTSRTSSKPPSTNKGLNSMALSASAMAENIDDDIEIEVAPFRGSHQLRYVPRPNLIWAFGEKFRLLIDGALQLSMPFADFVMLGENAIHGADRAQIDALVEQAGVDFSWSQIDKPRLLNASSTTGALSRQAPALALAVGARPQVAVSGGAWRR